jgi:hypothetical protein
MSTPVRAGHVGDLRVEVVNLIKAAARAGIDQRVIDELDALFAFLKEAGRLGLGVHGDGP